ncbi:hypothetical protein LTS17_001077 [Exophiala oligosperma]
MSPESEILTKLYGEIKLSLTARTDLSIPEQRAILERLHEAASEPIDVIYENCTCPGTTRPAIWCKPLSAEPSTVILYLHGGAGYAGSPSSHRKLAGHLAKAARAHALVLDYRLVPEHPFPAALDDISLAYQWLLDTKYKPSQIVFAGDSAGGNFAISSVLKAKQDGKPLPAAVVTFSPWVDMEVTGQSQHFNADKDVLTPPGVGPLICQMYLAGESPKNPLANALYADFEAMPPMHISVGEWELLLSDATRLADRAKAAGVDVVLEIASEMQHVYHFMAGSSPDADGTILRVGKWLQDKFDH